MSRTEIEIPTKDGRARAFVFADAGDPSPRPAIILFMDVFGIRPAMFEIAERISSMGYFVILPDMFWRLGAYEPLVPSRVLADPVKRDALLFQHMASTDPAKQLSDVGAVLDVLASQPLALANHVGVVGYCLGGAIAVRIAAAFPDVVHAIAAFHPGFLVSDEPDSPHLLASAIRGRVLVAGADNDLYFSENDRMVLEQSFEKGGVAADVTIYRGALHGFVPSDLPSHSNEATERHWGDLTTLLGNSLPIQT